MRPLAFLLAALALAAGCARAQDTSEVGDCGASIVWEGRVYEAYGAPRGLPRDEELPIGEWTQGCGGGDVRVWSLTRIDPSIAVLTEQDGTIYIGEERAREIGKLPPLLRRLLREG